MSKLLIVGAGPAGIRAAQTLVQAGLHPVVVDEAPQAGGQVYRRPPTGMTRSARQRYGSEAGKAQALHACFDQMVADGQLTHLPRSSVTALHGAVAQVLTANGLRHLTYDRLVLTTGAMDRIWPVPGWQSAGVYSLGAMQIALKSQEVVLGTHLVLAGSGPLLTLVAAQLLKAGARLAAVLDTAPMRHQLRGGFGMALARPGVTLRGLALRARLGRLYHAGVRDLRIATDDRGPTAVTWRDGNGQHRQAKCDAVGLGWHLTAETHLADLAGARFEWSDLWSQWLPCTDAYGRIDDGVYLAGDGLRILGADGAEIAGRLAAMACLQDLGRTTDPAHNDLRRLHRMQRFATGVAQAFPWPNHQAATLPDALVLCRCEGVTAKDIRTAAAQVGPDINRVKSQCRIGMGRCQGRYCQAAAAALIAQQTGTQPKQIGRLRAQPPIRPIPVSAALQD